MTSNCLQSEGWQPSAQTQRARVFTARLRVTATDGKTILKPAVIVAEAR